MRDLVTLNIKQHLGGAGSAPTGRYGGIILDLFKLELGLHKSDSLTRLQSKLFRGWTIDTYDFSALSDTELLEINNRVMMCYAKQR